MKNTGSICVIVSTVAIGVFFAAAELTHSIGHSVYLLAQTVLFACLVGSLLAIIRNTGRLAATIPILVSLAGIGALGSIAEHL